MRKRNAPPQSNKLVRSSTLVDIVIPVYNRSDLLDECLQHIPAAAGNITYATYVLDNGSKAEEATKIRSICVKYPHTTYVFSQKNLGFPAGCNKAALRGSSPLLFFLNDDVFLMKDSINNMVLALDDPTIGIVGAKLLFSPDSQDPNRPAGKVQHVGLDVNIRGQFIHIFVGWSANNPRVMKVRYPCAVTGAALMVRRALFKTVGGFCEEYGLGTYEDVELCLSIRNLGYNIYLEQTAMGIHKVGETAISQGIQYPLNFNYDLFKLRWQGKITYTEWENW